MTTDGLERTALGHWLVVGDHGVSASVRQHATFETPDNLRQIAAVAHCIPEGGVVVEAGACIGDQTTIYSRIVGAKGRVEVYEPYHVACAALEQNTAMLANVRVHPFALGAAMSKGMVPMSIVPMNVGASYLGGMARFGETFRMTDTAVSTLDFELADTDRLDFIHLDAEGMEAQILKGAETLIKKFHPAILVEVTDAWLRHYGSSSRELLQRLADYGYFTMVQLQPNPAQFDVLCLPTPLTGAMDLPRVEVTVAGCIS